MNNTNPYQAPQSPAEDTANIPAEGPKGLGGWLILVCIGLCGSILRLSLILVNTYLPIFVQNQWELFTTPGYEYYHPLWRPLLLFEIAANLVILMLSGYLLYLFFTKSRRFPRFFIGWLLLGLFFVISDLFLSNLIPAVAGADKTESLREISRTIAYALIWIPYMLLSERVKNTFVE